MQAVKTLMWIETVLITHASLSNVMLFMKHFHGFSVLCTVESLSCFISFLYLDLYVLGDDA